MIFWHPFLNHNVIYFMPTKSLVSQTQRIKNLAQDVNLHPPIFIWDCTLHVQHLTMLKGFNYFCKWYWKKYVKNKKGSNLFYAISNSQQGSNCATFCKEILFLNQLRWWCMMLPEIKPYPFDYKAERGNQKKNLKIIVIFHFLLIKQTFSKISHL